MSATAASIAKLSGVIPPTNVVGLQVLGQELRMEWPTGAATVSVAAFTESANGAYNYAIDSSGVLSREGSVTTKIEQGAGQVFAKLVGFLCYVEKPLPTSAATVSVMDTTGSTVLDGPDSNVQPTINGAVIWINPDGSDCSPSEMQITLASVANGALVHVVFIGLSA